MKTVEENANDFYSLLLQEERALISLNLDELTKIRNEKFYYLSWLESLLKNKKDLIKLNKEMIQEIKKKNLVLANLYKFSLSLFKEDETTYGNKNINSTPSLSIKA
jgi:hypothetical protein